MKDNGMDGVVAYSMFDGDGTVSLSSFALMETLYNSLTFLPKPPVLDFFGCSLRGIATLDSHYIS